MSDEKKWTKSEEIKKGLPFVTWGTSIY